MVDSQTNKDYLGMSDDDFLTINGPDPVPRSVTSPTNEDSQDPDLDGITDGDTDTSVNTESSTDGNGNGNGVNDRTEDPAIDDTAKSDGDPDAGSDESADTGDSVTTQAAQDNKKNKSADVAADGGEVDPSRVDGLKDGKTQEVDHVDFYKKVMAPFKANGRTIELKTPEEAIRLMQMGAGFGRKLQSLQPALKTLKMLEKNDLLDESKLSFLIDINNKNPEAIKKLIKESGIDPLDLNIEDNVSYTPKSHSVSDKEMVFHSTLDDIKSAPGGQETLRVVNQTWDQESLRAVWDQPEILGVIQSQRENGIYDQIAAEVDRQKLLGKIQQNTPFLTAYKLAGDHLQANNGFTFSGSDETIRAQSGDTPQKQVIATRTAAPKAKVQNGDKAAAAASTKTSPPRKAGTTINPLDMADDVFLKQFEGRF